jgi:hypothetical protein
MLAIIVIVLQYSKPHTQSEKGYSIEFILKRHLCDNGLLYTSHSIC